MSSISGVTSSSSSSYIFELSQEKTKQRKQNWDDLSSALESGDLDAAKTAFSAIKQEMAGKTSASSGSDSSGTSSSDEDNPMAKDFAALSKALDSGDLDAAQSAFETIQSHMKQGPPPPPEETSSTDSTDSTDSVSFTLKLINSTSDSDSDSTTSTDLTSSVSGNTTLSQLIAYLSNGSATSDVQAGANYKAQA